MLAKHISAIFLLVTLSIVGVSMAHADDSTCLISQHDGGDVPINNTDNYLLHSIDCNEGTGLGSPVYTFSGWVEPDTMSVVSLSIVGHFDGYCMENPDACNSDLINTHYATVELLVDGTESGEGGYFSLAIDTSLGTYTVSDGARILSTDNTSWFSHVYLPVHGSMEYGWVITSSDTSIQIDSRSVYIKDSVLPFGELYTYNLPVVSTD